MITGAFRFALCGTLAGVSFLCHSLSAIAAEATRVQLDQFTVCLPRNAGVIAGRRLTGGSGFDFLVSKQLAAGMGQPLNVVWYENELEEESDPVREAYAMLAFGLCDAVPGHPRYLPAVGVQDFERAVLPRWLGMSQDIDPDTGLLADRLAGFVDVKPVAVSQGYMRSEIGLVYREGTPEPLNLDDLHAQSLHLQQGTLAGVIAMMQTTAIDRSLVTTHNPGAAFLWNVEGRDGTLAIIDVAGFDSHAKSNPFTTLRLADWRHPIGMDIGIAVLSDRQDLLAEINYVIAGLPRQQLIEIANNVGMSYAAPQSDQMMPALTMQMLETQR